MGQISKAVREAGPMRDYKVAKVQTKPVNRYVSPVPSPFTGGRSNVSGASGYIRGGQRGKGKRGSSHLRPNLCPTNPRYDFFATKRGGNKVSDIANRSCKSRYDARKDPEAQRRIAEERKYHKVLTNLCPGPTIQERLSRSM